MHKDLWPFYLMFVVVILSYLIYLVVKYLEFKEAEEYVPPESYKITKAKHNCKMEYVYVVTYKNKYLKIRDGRDFLVNFTSLRFEYLDKQPEISGFGLYEGGQGSGCWFDSKVTCKSVIEKHKEWLRFVEK